MIEQFKQLNQIIAEVKRDLIAAKIEPTTERLDLIAKKYGKTMPATEAILDKGVELGLFRKGQTINGFYYENLKEI